MLVTRPDQLSEDVSLLAWDGTERTGLLEIFKKGWSYVNPDSALLETANSGIS